MEKILSIVMGIVLIGLSACLPQSSGSSTPTGNSGIEGYVTEGPMCPGPIQIGATECQDQPYHATIHILNAKGIQLAQFESDTQGYFKYALSPGTYILHPESNTPFPHAGDQAVLVTEGQYTQVSIVYDTGMR